MRMRTGMVVAAVAATLIAGSAFAATQSHKTTTTHKSAGHVMTGTIESYDAAGQALTLKTAKGSETFSTADAKVWTGSKSVALDQLASEQGARAKVTFSEKGGQKVATAIHVTPAAKPAH